MTADEMISSESDQVHLLSA